MRGECWPARDLVDFARFRDEFWGACGGVERARANKALSPTTCWMQIQSYIKGSVVPLIRGEPLTLDEYVDVSKDAAISRRRTADLSEADRRDCYAVFEAYERELLSRQLWDATDREVALIQRVLIEGFEDGRPPLDRVYCDEVQDMTQATLAVLLLAVGNQPESLFACGDTAQAIQDGVSFRFSDLKETIYELRNELEARRGAKTARGLGAVAPQMPSAAMRSSKPFKLVKNYRTHSGILAAANAVLGPCEDRHSHEDTQP